MVPMVGTWVRPWKGEALVGEVVAVSGDLAICRTPSNTEFAVQMAQIRSGRIPAFRSRWSVEAMNRPSAQRLASE